MGALSQEGLLALIAALQQTQGGLGGRLGPPGLASLPTPDVPVQPAAPSAPAEPEKGGGGKFSEFLSSPGAALLGQLVSGLGQGLLSGPSEEERDLLSAQTERLGIGGAAQNAQTFQQLMQLLLRSSGRGGL